MAIFNSYVKLPEGKSWGSKISMLNPSPDPFQNCPLSYDYTLSIPFDPCETILGGSSNESYVGYFTPTFSVEIHPTDPTSPGWTKLLTIRGMIHQVSHGGSPKSRLISIDFMENPYENPSNMDDILKWLESLYASLDVWWKNNLNLGVSWLKVKIWPVKMGIKHWQVGFQNWKMESWVREHQEVSIEQFNFMSLKSIHWAKCYCNHWKK